MTVATAEFEYLQKLVSDRSAIVLTASKQYLIESRLTPIARELGLADIGGVIEQVRRSRDRALEDRIIEAMTTNETLWMRDVHPFDALRKTVMPEIIERKGTTRQFAAWSAACSSGQEIYSLAMLLEENFPQLHSWRVELLGTDLSSEMVEKARSGSYSKLEMNRGLPASYLVRYFTPEGTGFTISKSIRDRVRFKVGNLAAPWGPMPKFDLIMLRNVLIYLDPATRKEILTQAAAALAPGGYLFLGSSETMVGISDLFRTQTADGATFYRLKGQE